MPASIEKLLHLVRQEGRPDVTNVLRVLAYCRVYQYVLLVVLPSVALACTSSVKPSPVLEAHTDTYNISVSYLNTKSFPGVDLYLIVQSATGTPVQGLDPGAFGIVENGRAVVNPIVSSVQNESISGALVIDRSGSMAAIGRILSSADPVVVREKPANGESSLATLKDGQLVVVVYPKPFAGSWYKIQLEDGRLGFVPAANLKFGKDKLDSAKEAAQSVVKLMRSNDSAAIVAFDNNISIVQGLTSDKALLSSKIDSIEAGGRTAFFDAIGVATNQINAAGSRRYIIALTDGLDNESKRTPQEVAQVAAKSKVQVHTIGLGDPTADPKSGSWVDGKLLSQIANDTGGQSFVTPSANDLLQLYSRIAGQIQFEYHLSYVSAQATMDGRNRTVVVRIPTGRNPTQLSFQYNPGGVIPIQPRVEQVPAGARTQALPIADSRGVAQNSGSDPLFVASLVALLALLAAPNVVSRGAGLLDVWWFRTRYLKRVSATSSYVGKPCPNEGTEIVEYLIQPGQLIVVCPVCKNPVHAWCWAVNHHHCYGYSKPCSGRGNVGKITSWTG